MECCGCRISQLVSAPLRHACADTHINSGPYSLNFISRRAGLMCCEGLTQPHSCPLETLKRVVGGVQLFTAAGSHGGKSFAMLDVFWYYSRV